MNEWDDLYFKKRIDFAFNRQKFKFDTGELLFSSHDIDAGTQLLLRFALASEPQPQRALDLGCGYGVIGIVLARMFPSAQITLSDQDLMALRYTRHNTELNATPNTSVVGSIGMEAFTDQNFDLILSNIPGHIGEPAIRKDFVLRPYAHLTSGGSYWLVIVTPLSGVIKQIATINELDLHTITERGQYCVYRIDKP